MAQDNKLNTTLDQRHDGRKEDDMTKREYERCTDLMNDALIHAKRSERYYSELREKKLSETDKYIKELNGQNDLGYAQGINQALAIIGFKHERMKELSKLI
ncbi:MAG TPA: hypothetical protein GXX75_06755 [Clostridiales bacterium]|nr:hypothetical protein [Clostridiales bacterium]